MAPHWSKNFWLLIGQKFFLFFFWLLIGQKNLAKRKNKAKKFTFLNLLFLFQYFLQLKFTKYTEYFLQLQFTKYTEYFL